MQRLRSSLDPFILSLLATVAIASAFPARGSGARLSSDVSTAGICLLFFLHGARLSPRAALDGLRQWRLHLYIFTLTFVLFPLLMLPLRLLEPGLIPHELFVGLVFLSVLPSTVQSSIAFTSIARGNVAAAVCSASLSNLIGVVLSPLLVSVLLGADARVSASSMVDVAAQLLLPFAAGQLARARIAPTLKRHPRALATVDRGSVLIVVYTAFGEGVVAGIWHRVSWQQLVTLGVIDIAALSVVLTVSTAGGRMLGFERGDRIAAVFCGSKKSLASGLPMATLLFPAATVSTIVLPLMIFHQIQLFACAALSRRYARQEGEEGEAVPAIASQAAAVLSS
ncbi:bile acid:sodium symporter family protein [Actinospica sp.]|uniref:bile acid:sodium symporter family protein n=1 Tax=Actinospica sp. TaxID=1872142 RepID=UPI002CBD8C59|nr:bile acid:sodium symporter family protein [Actinospica sp.]HWG26991.1 bile acid:sodium symporter family protein [Actinospica sp.]